MISGVIILIIFLSLSNTGIAQQQQLKSTAHGLHMMLGDVPKEQLIEEIRFEDGKNDTIDVIRFDHVGPNLNLGTQNRNEYGFSRVKIEFTQNG